MSPAAPAPAAVLGLVVLFVAAAWAAGTRLLRWCGPGSLRRWPAVLLVGVAVHATLALALGLCGLLFPATALVMLVVLAVPAIWNMRPRLPVIGRPDPFAVIALGGLGALAVLARAPQWWVDTLAYHLAAPGMFNALHKWVDVPHCQFRYRLLAEAWFGQGLLAGGEQVAGGLNTLSLWLLGWLVYDWSAEVAGRRAGWLAVAALAASTQTGFLAVHLKDDLVAAGFALLAVRWGARAVRPGSPAATLLAGCAVGWALSAKYTAAVPALGLVAWLALKLGSRGMASLRQLGWLAGGVVLAGGPFLVAGWCWTGNPVHPFLFGGLGWSAANAAVLHAYGAPGFDWDLTHPFSWIRAAARFVAGDVPLALAAVPVLSFLPVALVPAAGLWAIGFVPLAVAARSLRFLYPLVPFLAVASATTIESWVASRPRSGLRSLVRTAVAVVAGLGVLRSVGRADLGKHGWRAALGFESRPAFRERVLTTWNGVACELTTRLSSRDRVLVVGELRGYGLAPFALTRDLVDTPAMLELVRASPDAASISRHVRQTGARYVLLNDITAEYLAHALPPVFLWSPAELIRYRTFWERYAQTLPLHAGRDGDNGGFTLFAIRRTAGPVARALAYLPGTECLAATFDGESADRFAGRVIAAAQWLPGVAWLATRAAPELIRRGRFAEAATMIRPCLAAPFPQADVLHGQLGLALEGLGRFREAAAEFSKAARLNPRVAAYRNLRERAERSHRR